MWLYLLDDPDQCSNDNTNRDDSKENNGVRGKCKYMHNDGNTKNGHINNDNCNYNNDNSDYNYSQSCCQC